MPRVWSIIKKSQAGFSAVEVLLAATLFGLLVVAVTGAIIYGRGSVTNAGERMRATQIADEGTEIVRNMRDNSFVNLTDGPHGLLQSGGQWVFSGTSDVSGIFTRQVTITGIDGNRKLVTATVSWQQNSSTVQVTTSTRLTNWAAIFGSWSGGLPIGSYDAPGTNNALKIAVKSHYVYLVRSGSSSPNFLVIDVATPSSPTLAGSLTLAGSPTNISVNGNSAYVTNSSSTNQLQIINISSPSSPSLKTAFNCPGSAGALGISTTTNLAYVTRSSNGGNAEFCIINIPNSGSPSLAGTYSNNVNMYQVFVSGNDAYIVTGSDTQEIIDVNIQRPTLPTFTGSLNLPGTTDATSINSFGNTFFVGQGSTLYSLTVSSGVMSIAGNLSTIGAGTVNDIALDPTNTYLFLATDSATAEFQVVNASSLASMTVIRTLDVSGSLNGIAYDSNINAVVAASSSDTQELVMFAKN